MSFNPHQVGSAAMGFDALIYRDHPGTQDYLARQFKDPELVSGMRQIGEDYYLRQMELHQIYNGLAAQQYVAQVQQQHMTQFRAEGAPPPLFFVELNTAELIQTAPPHLQRFIMADEVVRTAWQEQKIQGYPETYPMDERAEHIGPSHYDWRLLNHGIVQDDGRTGFYLDDFEPGDRELSVIERLSLHRTNQMARLMLKFGQDPTDVAAGNVRE